MSYDAGQLLGRVRRQMASLIRSRGMRLRPCDVEDLTSELALVVLERHSGTAIPSWSYIRCTALEVLRGWMSKREALISPEEAERC